MFLEVYRGIRGKWQYGIHTSVFVEGDAYEWSYGTRSSPVSTHSRVYRGVVYERRRKYLYGDWIHWKSVCVGTSRRTCASDSMRAMRDARTRVKQMVGERFHDRGYHWLRNNCWCFCYELLSALGVVIPKHAIETLNDERLGVWRGTTEFGMKHVLRLLSQILEWIVTTLVRLRVG